MEGVAEHRLALGEEGDAAGVVPVPERQLALGEGAVLHHGKRDMLPHDGADVGAADVDGLAALIAGQGRVGVVEEDGAEVGGDVALAEEDDGVGAGEDREGGEEGDGAGGAGGEGGGERGETGAEAGGAVEAEEEGGEDGEDGGGAGEPAVGEIGEGGGDDEGRGEIDDELGVVGAGGDDEFEAAVAFAEGLDVLGGFEVAEREFADEAGALADDADGGEVDGALAVDGVEPERAVGAGREGEPVGDGFGGLDEVDAGDGGFADAGAGVIVEHDLTGAGGRQADLEGEEGGGRFREGQERHDDERAEEGGDEEGREREQLHAKRGGSGQRAGGDKALSARQRRRATTRNWRPNQGQRSGRRR